MSISMSFTANSEGGKYNVDLKHYHTSSTGYDQTQYYMGRPDDYGPDKTTTGGYAFQVGSSSQGEVRLFGTSYALEKESVLQPYKVIYRWRRTA